MYWNADPKPEKKEKTPYKGIKKKFPKSQGKMQLFRKIYDKCGGVCMVTGIRFPFNITSFAHVLSHGAYGRFELYEKNILFVNPRIHTLYDCENKAKLIKEFPEARMIYDLKEILKQEYYKK